MREFDIKHVACHVLISLYFIWLPVLCVLLGLALCATLCPSNLHLGKVLLLWIFLNLVIGTSLFAVLQLFGIRSRIGKVITYSYYVMAAASVITIAIAINQI